MPPGRLTNQPIALGQKLGSHPGITNKPTKTKRERAKWSTKTLDLGRQNCSMICLPDGAAKPTVMAFPGGAPFSPGMNRL